MDGADRPDVVVAHLRGEPIRELPAELYIPPDALEVFLEEFSGPLDLLLWLIRRSRMDIRDIPIAEVTRQYMGYLNLAQDRNLDLAAEYLLMAAWLAEIKARMLLPTPPPAEGEDEDPRAELARRLEALAECQAAAEAIVALPQAGRDFWPLQSVADAVPGAPLPMPTLNDLLEGWSSVLAKEHERGIRHVLSPPALSLRDRILDLLQWRERMGRGRWPWIDLLPQECGRGVLVLTFVALLELARQRVLLVRQNGLDGRLQVEVP